MTQSITNTYRLHCLARSNMEQELAKNGINSEVVAAYQEQKRIERGDFTGLVIETITCEAGSPADRHLSNRGRKNVQ